VKSVNFKHVERFVKGPARKVRRGGSQSRNAGRDGLTALSWRWRLPCHDSCVPYCTVYLSFPPAPAVRARWVRVGTGPPPTGMLLQLQPSSVASHTCLPGGRKPPRAHNTHELCLHLRSCSTKGAAGHGDHCSLPSLHLLLLKWYAPQLGLPHLGLRRDEKLEARYHNEPSRVKILAR
jgi:hypothetical protein